VVAVPVLRWVAVADVVKVQWYCPGAMDRAPQQRDRLEVARYPWRSWAEPMELLDLSTAVAALPDLVADHLGWVLFREAARQKYCISKKYIRLRFCLGRNYENAVGLGQIYLGVLR
jgi:hypothetical protein